MIIIPKEKGIVHPKILINKIEEYKKYGTIIKKGKEISLIDPIIIFNVELADKIRRLNNEQKTMAL